MYCMSKMALIIAVVPISLLMVLSFFVLLSIGKAQTKGLKIFGLVVATLLWLAVATIILGGVYGLAKSGNKKCMMQKKMMMQGAQRMSGMQPEQKAGKGINE
ncbi:MAG: hypothetical protein L6308_02910 [Candidatus Omnitrophica bacterium]|nr:hypothetical protein [Candidatus Omnitrophota bacterium]